MSRTKVVVPLGFMVLALSLFPDVCVAHCVPSSCGSLIVSPPFRLKSDPIKCPESEYELVCENNRTVLHTSACGKFFVEEISYEWQTVRLLDASLHRNKCSFPCSRLLTFPCARVVYFRYITENSIMYVLNCNMRMNSALYVDASNFTNSSSSPHTYFFLFKDNQTQVSDFNESCRIEAQFPVMLSNVSGLSASDIYDNLLMGFKLNWTWFDANNSDCSSVWREPWM
ncbi:hypothetical protein SLEP1_g53616 [Rubroshorea leprosula]|uniref:Wall-associated receptor kinase galacturonan-binding domain-containing protein n=1 Tax=Rubroshorea leprosula TaxID=152421 RepID=A0AAV5MDG3_9ROSI|nr:hypothetical protein SLEP1_g53616 [Rubroshorea leprosula]